MSPLRGSLFGRFLPKAHALGYVDGAAPRLCVCIRLNLEPLRPKARPDSDRHRTCRLSPPRSGDIYVAQCVSVGGAKDHEVSRGAATSIGSYNAHRCRRSAAHCLDDSFPRLTPWAT